MANYFDYNFQQRHNTDLGDMGPLHFYVGEHPEEKHGKVIYFLLTDS